MRVLTYCLIMLVATGCQTPAGRQADISIPSAHPGGSTLAISPDSRTLASGGWSGKIRLWNLESGTNIQDWQAHAGAVTGIFFLDDRHLASVGYDGWIRTWTRDGKQQLQRDSGTITAATLDLERQLLLTGHKNGKVRAWQLDDLSMIASYAVHHGFVRSVAIDQARTRYASSGKDGRTALIDTADDTIRYLAPSPSDPRRLLFTPDDRGLMGSGWFRLFHWNLATDTLKTLPTAHRGIINDIYFMPDGQLASISRQTDSAVLLLDPITGQTNQRLQQHELCGVAVEVSNNGRYLATSSDDASVRIWKLAPADIR